MEIRTSFKPTPLKAPTKDTILYMIRSKFGVTSYSINSYGSGLLRSGYNHDSFVVYNLEKYRSKRGVRKAHWKAYVYIIPVDFLKVCGLKAIQNKRNFELKKAV